jgi:capsular exopolysaccharide synthesis family protein
MELLGYLKALRKNWWIVLVVTAVGVGLAGGLAARTTPKYVSTLSFFVSTKQSTPSGLLAGDQYAQQRVGSYVILISQERVANLVLADPNVKKVLSDTHVTMSAAALANEIGASAETNTVILNAQVTDTSTERAQVIATSLATQFVSLVKVIDPAVELQLIAGPTLNSKAVSPKTSLDLSLGLLIGLALGIAIAVLRDRFSPGMKSADVLRASTSYPVLGEIGNDRSAKTSPLVVKGPRRSARIEAYRQLRTSLQFAGVDEAVGVILVTSAVANEGKSTTAANLAMVFADTGQRVLLVEADLRRPRVAEYFGLERAVGLSNILAGQVELDDVLQPWGDQGLNVLPSGSIPPNPSELLGGGNMRKLMQTLRTKFDVIVIDSPPLLPVTDAAVTSSHSDGVLVVVRAGKTSRNQIEKALQSLHSVDAKILGWALNMIPGKRRSRSVRDDGYGYIENDPAGRSRD